MQNVPFNDEREMHLSQGTIRYRDVGDGPTLVFVHGLLANGMLWRKVVPQLASEYRCIVPDWPLGAHSLPMPPDADLTPPAIAKIIADFIAALNLDEVTLVGHDTGGGIVQIVLANHPQRIARMVLTNCDAFEMFPPPALKLKPIKYAAYLPGAVFLLSQIMRSRVVQHLFIKLYQLGKRPFEQVALDSYFGPFAQDAAIRRDLAKFLRGMEPRHTLAAARTFAERPQPVLIAWGAEDRLFPLQLGKRLQAAFPNAQLVLLEDALTFTPEDQPQRLAELIAAFVPKAELVS